MGFTQFVHFGVSVQPNEHSSIAAARNADGRIEIFAIGNDGSIQAKAQSTPNGNFNSWWNLIPAGAKDLAAVSNSDGRIELLYVAPNHSGYGRGQVLPNGNFGGEYTLGGSLR